VVSFDRSVMSLCVCFRGADKAGESFLDYSVQGTYAVSKPIQVAGEVRAGIGRAT
jgi:hypothetical protein